MQSTERLKGVPEKLEAINGPVSVSEQQQFSHASVSSTGTLSH